VEVDVLNSPDGDVIAKGSRYSCPDCAFIVAADGQVYFRAVGYIEMLWAGRDAFWHNSIVR
jgi:hypothetical protein